MRSFLIGTLAAALTVTALAEPVKVGYIELDGPIAARQSTLGLGGTPSEVTMRDVLKAVGEAGTNAGLKGLVIRLKDAELDTATIEELGAAIAKVRATGRKVHLYAEGYSIGELMLGSACDEVLLQRGGEVSLPGIHMEEMFLADTFKWIGVTPDFVQVGAYKGASEMYANTKPSPEWDQNINGLLDSMYANVRSHIGKGRKLSDAKLDEAMEKAWMADAATAKSVGLIDAEIDLPELDDHLAKVYGGEIEWETGLLEDPAKAMKKSMSGGPFALLGSLLKEAEYKTRRTTIAVLHIDGAIIDGESSSGGLFGGGGEVGSRTIKRTIQDLLEDDNVKGVVMRIDSPGGSAIASEMMWQSIKKLREKKPVYVSVGSMAASGGYYLAVAGEKIYVNPSSIVGSIGVVGGKMALGGVYEKLKINVVPRSRGPHAGMFGSSASPWTETERSLVREKMTQTYELFSKRVLSGRKGIELDKTAAGRLFTGEKALSLKMADKIGGFEVCRDDLARSLNLTPGAFDVMDYPAPKGFAEVLESMFSGFGVSGPTTTPGSIDGPIASEVRGLVRSLVGDANERRLSGAMSALWQMRNEPVILASPRVLIFK